MFEGGEQVERSGCGEPSDMLMRWALLSQAQSTPAATAAGAARAIVAEDFGDQQSRLRRDADYAAIVLASGDDTGDVRAVAVVSRTGPLRLRVKSRASSIASVEIRMRLVDAGVEQRDADAVARGVLPVSGNVQAA